MLSAESRGVDFTFADGTLTLAGATAEAGQSRVEMPVPYSGAQVIVSLVKALLFGLSAGLIACYKGLHVGGGPTAVGNAVNETVVFAFIALFLINILATAFGVKVAP